MADAKRPLRSAREPAEEAAPGEAQKEAQKGKGKRRAARDLDAQAPGAEPVVASREPRPKQPPKLTQQEREGQARSSANALVSSASAGAATLFGDEARMTRVEQDLIEKPLERILLRLEPAAVEAVATWTDPLVLGLGLLAWGSRVARIAQERQAAEEASRLSSSPPGWEGDEGLPPSGSPPGAPPPSRKPGPAAVPPNPNGGGDPRVVPATPDLLGRTIDQEI